MTDAPISRWMHTVRAVLILLICAVSPGFAAEKMTKERVLVEYPRPWRRLKSGFRTFRVKWSLLRCSPLVENED